MEKGLSGRGYGRGGEKKGGLRLIFAAHSLTLTPMQKLYAYVDETGQDTEGALFLVSVVVTGQERRRLQRALEQIEQTTKKGARKWRKASFTNRLNYLRAVFSNPLFHRNIFFAQYAQTKAYFDLTVYSTARAILKKAEGNYKATVLVDGLEETELRRFGKELRRLQIKVEKVRGLREGSDALIRLADAIAGFVRDAQEGQTYARQLYQEALRKEIVQEM